MPDGKPLMLTMASTPTTRDREIDEIWQKNLKAIGIRVEFIKQKWPDLLKMGKAGQLQFWRIGWINAYAEGDAFAQLLYGKNIGPDELFALRPAGLRHAVPSVADASGWRRAQQAVSADVGARGRVQPVGVARVPGRDDAVAAVGARLQEARVLGASRGSTLALTTRNSPRADASITCRKCDRRTRKSAGRGLFALPRASPAA
jgi:hypothetical protein